MKGHYQNLKFAGQQQRATFATTGTVEAGDAVALTAAGQVGRGSDGDPVFGIVERVESDGYATVLMFGEVITAQRTGAISVGRQHVDVDGAGKIKAAATPTVSDRPALVIGTQTEDSVDLVTLVLL